MTDALRDRHPSEEDLLRHLDGELSATGSARVLTHLEACWTCRARVDRLQEAIRAFTEFVEEPLTTELPEPPRGWGGFAMALRHASADHLPLRGGPGGSSAFSRMLLVSACLALIVLAAMTAYSPAAAEVLAAAWRVVEHTFLGRESGETPDARATERAVAPAPSAPVTAAPDPPALPAPQLAHPQYAARAGSPIAIWVPPARPSGPELDRLELEACYHVHHFGLCWDTPSAVRRTRQGVRVAATVPSDERKTLVLQALDTLMDRPGMEVEVEVAAMASGASDLGRTSDTPIETHPSPDQPRSRLRAIPAVPDLQRYLLLQMNDRTPGVSRQMVEGTIATLTAWTLERSARRVEEARAVTQLLARWPVEVIQGMGPDAVAMWHAMLAHHARTLEDETEMLRLQLQPIFFPALAVDADRRDDVPEDEVTPGHLADRLWAAVVDEDRWIQQAFSPAADPAQPDGARPDDARPDYARLGRSLQASRTLAARLSAPQMID